MPNRTPTSAPTITPSNTTTGEPSTTPQSINAIRPAIVTTTFAENKTIFGLNLTPTREQAHYYSPLVNGLAASSTETGFMLSAINGALRLINPANTHPYATKAMDAARPFYNGSSTLRSLYRFWTTIPSARPDETAKAYAYASNTFSVFSFIHGLSIFAGHIDKINFPKTFKIYAKGCGFNGTALSGIFAAMLYNASEKKQTDSSINIFSEKLAQQYSAETGKNVTPKEALDIVKRSIPHMGEEEFKAKNYFAYSISATAAFGGLLNGIDKFPGLHAKMIKLLGVTATSLIIRGGGITNGAGYASAWPVYFTQFEGKFKAGPGEECMMPKRAADDLAKIREQAKPEMNTLLIYTSLAIAGLALTRGKVLNANGFKELFAGSASIFEKFRQRAAHAGELLLNKADVYVLGMYGLLAIAKNPEQAPGTSLSKDPAGHRSFEYKYRLGIISSAEQWLDATDPRLSSKDQEKMIREYAEKNNIFARYPNTESMETKDLRKFIEETRCVKIVSKDNDGNVTRRNHIIGTNENPEDYPNRKPVSPAKYTLEARKLLDEYVKERDKPNTPEEKGPESMWQSFVKLINNESLSVKEKGAWQL